MLLRLSQFTNRRRLAGDSELPRHFRDWPSGAFLLRNQIGLRGQAAAGVIFFFGIVADVFGKSSAVNWHTIGWGIALQALLALSGAKSPFVQTVIEDWLGCAAAARISCFEGSKICIRQLVRIRRPAEDGGTWSRLIWPNWIQFQFAFIALPPILFISAFFTVLYHFGILQRLVANCSRKSCCI